MGEKQISQELLQASMLLSMLNGKDLSTITRVDDDEDFGFDFEHAGSKPKKKTSKKKTEQVKKEPEIPMVAPFRKINNGLSINIFYAEHDIHYKEQDWKINARAVPYKLELVKSPYVATKAAKQIHGDKAEIDKVRNGEIRYFKVVSYEEALKYELREVAYIEASVGEFKGKKQIVLGYFINNKLLENNNANPSAVAKALKNIGNQLIG